MNAICFSVDVEWASDEVLQDLVSIFNERNIRATFFCTHPNILVPGHERGIHPNFRYHGDTLGKLRADLGPQFHSLSESEIYKHVLRQTLSYCPEAIGNRSHSLFYDSLLLSIYHDLGIKYDSSYFIPLTLDLKPFWKEYNILELPIYYIDHFDLKTGKTNFNVDQLRLDLPGLKILNFHPNMVFINASSNEDYLNTKSFYHDSKRLKAERRPGRGVRSLLFDLLDQIEKDHLPTSTLGQVYSNWTSVAL